jgi:uncharacterized membrane protein
MRHLILVRQLRARPRLASAALLGVVTALILPGVYRVVTRGLIGWNVGCLTYLALAAWMMANSSEQRMLRRARVQDDGRWVVLALMTLGAAVSLVAVAAQLATAKDFQGVERIEHMALAGLTVFTSWAFTQTMFALHYAHDFYMAHEKGLPGGLTFPSEEKPTYGDFLYFAFVIGTSGQTADVAITSKAMRRIGLLHCVLAFLFNTTVLALTINIAASLI